MKVGCWRSSGVHQQRGNDNKSSFDCSFHHRWTSIRCQSLWVKREARFKPGTLPSQEKFRRKFAAKWLLISLRNDSPKSFSFCAPTPGMRRNSVEFVGYFRAIWRSETSEKMMQAGTSLDSRAFVRDFDLLGQNDRCPLSQCFQTGWRKRQRSKLAWRAFNQAQSQQFATNCLPFTSL